MSFEVKEKDLLSRIGKLKTKTSTVETPLLFPVINPNIQPVSPKRLKEEFGFDALITNAYILKKRYGDKVAVEGLHKFLNFDGAVMTDSGAYQILVYGGVEVNQAEIVDYQERIGSDIATMLDIPTGWNVTKEHAARTVDETLRRARILIKTKKRNDLLWVGPIQGGRHLDLVVKSAKEIGKLPFQIHALGSPTEVMENYRYDVLADMIMTAKHYLPIERPMHLFGAGHPAMFALAVALGCDLFDSAAYALYARKNRYMTENGTWRLGELDYFPCQCPKCATETPEKVRNKTEEERVTFLAEHNLHVCLGELRRIKQSIRDGRLWEHLEMRAHAHPALLTAVKKLEKHKDLIEKHSPTAKRSGLFFLDSHGLTRPEVVHYKKRFDANYTAPENSKILFLAPQTRNKPFHKAREFHRINQIIKSLNEEEKENIHVCFYAAPFGVTPIELDEVYPLSQHETAMPLDRETIEYVAKRTAEYIKSSSYEIVVLLHESPNWADAVEKVCRKVCKQKGTEFESLSLTSDGGKEILTRLLMILKKKMSEKP